MSSEIAIREDHREPAGTGGQLLVGEFRLRFRFPPRHGISDAHQHDTDHQHHCSSEKKPGRAVLRGDLSGPDRAQPCPEAAANANHRKQPLALLFGVEIGGKRPELGDHHHVEDAHPEKKHDADAHAGRERRKKQQEIRCEEERDPLHQLDAVDARRQHAVRGHNPQEQQRLPGRRITLHLGATLAEDETLSRGLQQVIPEQHEEHRGHHQQGTRPFAAAHVRKRREQPLDRAFLRDRASRGRAGGRDVAHREFPATDGAAASGRRCKPTSFHPAEVRRKCVRIGWRHDG